MTPQTLEREFDVVMIGAGAVGENVADRAVQGGLTAVVIEAELVGGECSYWACMPSKALLRSGTALHGAQTVPGAEEAVTRTLDAAAVLKRRDYMTANWQDDGAVKWLEDAGIELIRGHGRLTGPASRGSSRAGRQHLPAQGPSRRRACHRLHPEPTAHQRTGRAPGLGHPGSNVGKGNPGTACRPRRRRGRHRTGSGVRPPGRGRDAGGQERAPGQLPGRSQQPRGRRTSGGRSGDTPRHVDGKHPAKTTTAPSP